MQKVSSNQDRMCYLEASEVAKKQFYMLGHLQGAMFSKEPLGKDKVRNGMKEMA